MPRKRLFAAVVPFLALTGAACPQNEPPPDVAPGFERKAMLANLADEVILPTLTRFEGASAALADACETWAAESPPGATSEARTNAQAAFHAAMDVWQEAEVMQIGPAGMTPPTTGSGGVMGGQGLRDRIYSWPSTNACAVDQQIVANEFRADGFFERKLVDVSGLDALEYLLFVEGEDNACAGPSTINSEGSWAALSAEQVWQRRADYCASASAYLERTATRLRNAWEPSGGDFRGQLVDAGASGSIYMSPAEALDALYAALFYVELTVKDRKLALPAGLHVDCLEESCPELAESRFAKRSKENIAANLRGFENLLLGRANADGPDGLGFDDYLREANAADLADRMAANIAALSAQLESFEGTLEDALVSDVEKVRALHGAVKTITDDLKSQMPSVLGLRVPEEGHSDND